MSLVVYAPSLKGRPSQAPIGFSRWRVWGTSVTVAVQPASEARRVAAVVQGEIAAVDRACNRFRPDSELSRVNRAAGKRVRVSARFCRIVGQALLAAVRSDGAVDPTIGSALELLGYDRDIDQVAAAPSILPLGGVPVAASGWRSVDLDPAARTVALPPRVHLDLGATAKAGCADRAADAAHARTGASVLVDLGGDLAIAGPPPATGWRVGVVEDARRPGGSAECVVAVWDGGLASSGTTVRTWSRAGWPLHHIIDPATGWPAPAVWRLVTVGARTCIEANTASTAAVVWGEDAPFRLAQIGLPARLVRADGAVVTVGDWPEEDR